MKEQEEILESFVREVILTELEYKPPFKRGIRRAWEKLKYKFKDSIDSIVNGNHGRRYRYQDDDDFSGYFPRKRSTEFITSAVDSWSNEFEDSYDKKITSTQRDQEIKRSKKIFGDSIRQGYSPEEAMDLVLKYLTKKTRYY